MGALSSLWWLLVAIAVLVPIHEFGHYLAARWCGVKVLRFSVGFGKPIFLRRDSSGTEWVVAWIPLGGYVRMLGEHELADHVEPVSEAERAQAHGSKTVLQRMLISAAGPFANLVLCVALLWLMFVVGRPDYAPVAGKVDGLVASAGLRAGDTLLALDDRETPTWTEASTALMASVVEGKPVAVKLRAADGTVQTRTVDFSKLPADQPLEQRFRGVGFLPRHLIAQPVVGRVEAGTAAEGKLRPGDRIAAIDGQPIRVWDDIAPAVARMGRAGGGTVAIVRDGLVMTLPIVPRLAEASGKPGKEQVWQLGIGNSAAPMDAMLRYGPLDAVPAAFGEARYQLGQLLDMFRLAFRGRLAARDTVSGPVGIAQAAKDYASRGFAWYLSLLAVLSLSLAVLNLLPIPVLDGGHLLYYLIELLKGRPLSERAMAAGQYVGLALLLGLMGLAFFNDLQRLIP